MHSPVLILTAAVLYLSVVPVNAETSVDLHGITDTLKPEHEKYADALNAAAAAFRDAEELFNSDAFKEKRGWKKDGESKDGVFVYTTRTPKGDKLATLSIVLDGDAKSVMHETWNGVVGLEKWNLYVIYASVVASLTDHADITHYGSSEVLSVAGRDFVSARMYRPLPGGGFMIASRSVNVSDVPFKPDRVRADLQLGAARFRPDPSAPEKRTICDVIMQIDLKGEIPKLLVNQVTPQLMLLDAEENKKHFKKLWEQKAGGSH